MKYAAAKRGRAEKEEDLVSLGSDDDDDGHESEDDDDQSEDDDEATGRGNGRSNDTDAERWEREPPLAASTLLTSVASSRSLLKSAAAVARGMVGAQRSGKRAK